MSSPLIGSEGPSSSFASRLTLARQVAARRPRPRLEALVSWFADASETQLQGREVPAPGRRPPIESCRPTGHPAFEGTPSSQTGRRGSYNVEQEVEHQVNDDKEHHDSDDVSGIQGFASWTSVLGKPFMDVSAAEYVISPSITFCLKAVRPSPGKDPSRRQILVLSRAWLMLLATTRSPDRLGIAQRRSPMVAGQKTLVQSWAGCAVCRSRVQIPASSAARPATRRPQEFRSKTQTKE